MRSCIVMIYNMADGIVKAILHDYANLKPCPAGLSLRLHGNGATAHARLYQKSFQPF